MFRNVVRVPRPPPIIALLIVVIWAIALCVVDAAAMLRVRRHFVLVDSVEHCHRDVLPRTEWVVAKVRPGDQLRVRNFERTGTDLCYLVETSAKTRGWVPYNSAYMSSSGIGIRLRAF